MTTTITITVLYSYLTTLYLGDGGPTFWYEQTARSARDRDCDLSSEQEAEEEAEEKGGVGGVTVVWVFIHDSWVKDVCWMSEGSFLICFVWSFGRLFVHSFHQPTPGISRRE